MQRIDPFFQGINDKKRVAPRMALLLGPAYFVVELLALLVHLAFMLIHPKKARITLANYTCAVRYRAGAMLGKPDANIWHLWAIPGNDSLLTGEGKLAQPAKTNRDIPILLFCLFVNAISFWVLVVLGYLVTQFFQFYFQRLLAPLSLGEGSPDLVGTIVLWLVFSLGAAIYPRIIYSLAQGNPMDEQEIRQLHRSRREIVDAFEIERRRIERDLHDGAQQYLVAASMKVGEAELSLSLLEHELTKASAVMDADASQDRQGKASEEAVLGEDAPPTESADSLSGSVNQESVSLPQFSAKIQEVLSLLRQAQDANDRSLVALRRTVAGVHPKVLSDKGLAEAVRDVCADSPVQVEMHLPEELPSLPAGAAAAAYYLVCESLTNIAKHVANPKASLLIVAGSSLVISIVDNGGGGAKIIPGHGLAGLQARLEAFGGNLRILSPLGGPTTVRAEIPILIPSVEEDGFENHLG